MMKLPKYEKETIINWNEAENTASIYTFNADLKRRLAEFSRKYPLLCRLERSIPEGSVTYVIDKSRLSVRLIPPYSEERLAAAREYAKQHGFQVLRAEKESV
ncbi:molecular chaperone [Butyricicoccus sp. AM27-36]|uniref:molecular chaperone n=1 Tax=Butyricicoccus sp. AM27-36 TaxID=2292293 RepID=UPI000E5471DD|nr:molecular chaperone [Butyricicoccus sp. AM27-36]RHT86105.1 molecular chaperone [Butyricicoccus sp. AM27-36]